MLDDVLNFHDEIVMLMTSYEETKQNIHYLKGIKLKMNYVKRKVVRQKTAINMNSKIKVVGKGI